jgi:predicted nucleic acid-binding Zn ribbon protein
MKKICLVCNKEYEANSNSQKMCNDCKIRECKNCGKKFKIENYYRIKKGMANFCSIECYLESRWSKKNCVVCGKEIPKESRHYRYCSEKCYKKGLRLFDKQRWEKRKRRFKEAKLKLIKKLGGKCMKCGFSDIMALEFHHLEKRNDYQHNNERFLKFLKDNHKLQLLCANCHRILHKERGWGK